MKYMLLIYGNQQTWDALYTPGTDQVRPEVVQAHQALIGELTASGELVGSAGLTANQARTVRLAGGDLVVSDGPFVEVKEVLAGYYMVECASVERATEIASRLPEAPYSPIEIREVIENPLA